MAKVVFDSNIYISSLVFGGQPGAALLACTKNQVAIYLSIEIDTEVENVLKRTFKWRQGKVDYFFGPYRMFAFWLEPQKAG